MNCRLLLLVGLLSICLASGCSSLVPPKDMSKPAVTGEELCADPEPYFPGVAEEFPEIEMAEQEAAVSPPKPHTMPGDRGLCYILRPAGTGLTKKGTKVGGCCQPQSLIYARCRSGMGSCRLGDTSPVQWFSCAKKYGYTNVLPRAGTIMVFDSNPRRKMPTGHPVFVEEAIRNGNGTWKLRISHTNYDRQCHLDLDAAVHYDPTRMTASFESGAWSAWARDLRVLGFIER